VSRRLRKELTEKTSPQIIVDRSSEAAPQTDEAC
jgi:hypothetical protein